jgi:hypothetical protein
VIDEPIELIPEPINNSRLKELKYLENYIPSDCYKFLSDNYKIFYYYCYLSKLKL